MFQINESEAAVICDLTNCVTKPSIQMRSAIDGFDDQLRYIIKRGFESASDPFTLGLLVMALTSASETYFRTIIAGTVAACPVCNSNNLDKGRISFRAIEHYPASMLVLALLEHVSFSDSEAIRKQTSELLQISVPATDKGSSSIATALQNYDRVCALRHALIHSSGLINSQNCAEAGLQEICVISPSIAGLQIVAEICRNAALSFNQFLFDTIIGRLYQKGYLTGDYQTDGPHLGPILQLFLSSSSPAFSSDQKQLHGGIHAAYGPKA
jgi:hypothetical protein